MSPLSSRTFTATTVLEKDNPNAKTHVASAEMLSKSAPVMNLEIVKISQKNKVDPTICKRELPQISFAARSLIFNFHPIVKSNNVTPRFAIVSKLVGASRPAA